jgi:hypothetical protein
MAAVPRRDNPGRLESSLSWLGKRWKRVVLTTGCLVLILLLAVLLILMANDAIIFFF